MKDAPSFFHCGQNHKPRNKTVILPPNIPENAEKPFEHFGIPVNPKKKFSRLTLYEYFCPNCQRMNQPAGRVGFHFQYTATNLKNGIESLPQIIKANADIHRWNELIEQDKFAPTRKKYIEKFQPLDAEGNIIDPLKVFDVTWGSSKKLPYKLRPVQV